MDTTESVPEVKRIRMSVSGQVQGVGFRPFVHRVAQSLGLRGFVRNTPDGAVVEVEGAERQLGEFRIRFTAEKPVLAEIRAVTNEPVPPRLNETEFSIHSSIVSEGKSAQVTVDTAMCAECVSEILSSADRRRGYGLTNCTNCGPRYSIVQSIPYDRCNTTMAGFVLCPTCSKEYENPADRRFHAQPTACHDCGPTVTLVDPAGNTIAGDAIAVARQMLRDGKILAIKGLGGFHLAVRADLAASVRRLRTLKRRDHKPFALMVRTIDDAGALVHLSGKAIDAMQSPVCPIILAVRKSGVPIAADVAPESHRLGVMLPYTPIHHLLFAEGMPPLVMTSGNVSDEPLVIDNVDALELLGPMCDGLLWHDRAIARGVDDSIFIDAGDESALVPLRRARGLVPQEIQLSTPAPAQGIALGAELKNTVAVVRSNGSTVLSQHLGDLMHAQAFGAFRSAVDDLQKLFGVSPQWIAHDLHPQYVSTGYASKLSAKLGGVPTFAVQHHHAHAASLMAEHEIGGPILAVVCDGTGYGTDGTIWGGEVLHADHTSFQRLAHLRPLSLPGGDAAARDITRSALALLHHAYCEDFHNLPIVSRLVPAEIRRNALCQMIETGFNCARSSGAGRYFDAIAALLGLSSHNHYEGQAAMRLEAVASQSTATFTTERDWFELNDGDSRQIDFAPLVREFVHRIERGVATAELPALFHEQLARALAAVTIRASEQTGVRIAGLSGGVFCNVRLSARLTQLLEQAGMTVLRHRRVPPNDGGIALGQCAIAAARYARGERN